MEFSRLVLLLVYGFVIFRLSSSASMDMYESEKSKITVVNLFHAPDETRTTAPQGEIRTPNHQLEYDNDEDYVYESEEDDYLSGDYEIELPRVAFSTKPKDLSVVPVTERRKGKRKGKGKKRNPCLRKYKDFCIHGVCQYLRELRAPSCICPAGYSGERCHLVILPVAKEAEGYNRTTALAAVAVVLSLMCLTIIGFLLALRYRKKGDYEVENEEKVKLEMASVQ